MTSTPPNPYETYDGPEDTEQVRCGNCDREFSYEDCFQVGREHVCNTCLPQSAPGLEWLRKQIEDFEARLSGKQCEINGYKAKEMFEKHRPGRAA